MTEISSKLDELINRCASPEVVPNYFPTAFPSGTQVQYYMHPGRRLRLDFKMVKQAGDLDNGIGDSLTAELMLTNVHSIVSISFYGMVC